ncbi:MULTISPECIES: ABC transporter substrate-binding protein [Streptomyces]|uniref:Multiple sugar-binding protein n=1 Tax=Streptomyces fradiae ATCC 10745 = DSM 40063 TaxID=1319510 RepID=A0A1Y2NS35_STRFR|nr:MULTISPECIES: ABC transporter substrate-binding protein [Streptomyces]KAF0651642.1 sugar ABC transporter substrate-binding protein [Streptomyces fradiae ATCC 10745 = DSM 40063]OSY50296.1 Multiple sugar-binding protein precursor [Streptomyces fradiae ATCC 10745 = DSM 40063]QEV11082.1 carbohydrate ABC transporter substrate-binding protein [Streptomyces fradiae ATCC 10745 = DSM 40063]
MTSRRSTAVCASTLAAALALGATACGGDPVTAAGGDGKALAGQTLTVAGVWSGAEQKNFQKVLDAFTAKTGAQTRFVSTGDNVSTVVGSKIEGGNAPDVVMVPQVGVLRQFAARKWLAPLPEKVEKSVDSNYAPVWKGYGSVDGTLYGLYFKASNKSTVWYSPDVLDQAGVQPPKTYDEMLAAARAVADSGTPAFAVAGEDGWTLTDWFENVYLSQAGPEKYDRLARHEIKWTDPSVVESLKTLSKLFSDDKLLAGGRNGALATDFPGSVEKVFGPKPEAGMVYEGDFVAGVAKDEFGRKIGEDAKFFPFPAVGGGKAPVVSGGDAAVVLKDGRNRKAADAFLEFLATPEAAAVWAAEGGFLSPNKALDTAAYGDPTLRATAESLVGAGDSVRFDMSDQAPASFGGTKGAGEWKILQDFLRDPSDPAATAAELEAAAAKAFRTANQG